MKNFRIVAVLGGVTLASIVGLAITLNRATGTDSAIGDPDADLIAQFEEQLRDGSLDAQGRALLQGKLDTLRSEQGTRTAAPRIDKASITPPSGPTEPRGVITPQIREPVNETYHDGYAKANNMWIGYVDGHGTSVFAANLGVDREQGILTVWIRWLGDAPGRQYEARIPRRTGALHLIAFDDTTVTAQGADGSRWRLVVKTGELTEVQ